MADELIDRFDDNGNNLGVIMKSEAHKIGAWHRAVHIYLINNNGELIIQQRSPDKALFPNLWDISVGGHVSAGEQTIISAQRELFEELGINAEQSELKYLFTFKEVFHEGNFLSKEFVDVFLIKKDVTSENIKLQEEEVASMKFVKISEFLNMIDRKDEKLIPHYEEYEKMKDILVQYIKN